MTALFVSLAVLVLGAAVLAVAIWASPLGAALLALVIVSGIVWYATLRASDHTITDAVRRSGDGRPELLAPGDPDDPAR